MMTGRRAAVALVVVLAVASLAAPATATHQSSRKLILDLEADGDAAVTYRISYELSNATDRGRFEAIESGGTAREQRLDRFGETLRAGARIVRNQTNRNSTVAVGDATAQRYDNGTGMVRLHARWTAVGDERGRLLVVTEPFVRDYRPQGRLAFVAPDGYLRETSQPPPGVARLRSVVWSAHQDTGGMFLSFVPEPTPTPAAASPPAGMSPFLGAVAIALVPVIAVAFALGRRE